MNRPIIQRDLSATEQMDAVLAAITYLASNERKRALRRSEIFYGCTLALLGLIVLDQFWDILGTIFENIMR